MQVARRPRKRNGMLPVSVCRIASGRVAAAKTGAPRLGPRAAGCCATFTAAQRRAAFSHAATARRGLWTPIRGNVGHGFEGAQLATRVVGHGSSRSMARATAALSRSCARRPASTTTAARSARTAEDGGEELLSDQKFAEELQRKMKRGVLIGSAALAILVAAPGFYFVSSLANNEVPEHAGARETFVGTWRSVDGTHEARFNKYLILRYNGEAFGGKGNAPVQFGLEDLEVGFSKVTGKTKLAVQQWPKLGADGRFRMRVNGVELVRESDEAAGR